MPSHFLARTFASGENNKNIRRKKITFQKYFKIKTKRRGNAVLRVVKHPVGSRGRLGTASGDLRERDSFLQAESESSGLAETLKVT